MPSRNTTTHVTFKRAFQLAEIDQKLPAGRYEIETEEKAIEGNRRTVYVRTATFIWVESLGRSRMVKIDPAGLEAALLKDSRTNRMSPS